MVLRIKNTIYVYKDLKQKYIYFSGEKNYSLVLEYADGGTLRKYLRKNATAFKWEDQLRFAKEITGAISYLHDLKIIHRDLVSLNYHIFHYFCFWL